MADLPTLTRKIDDTFTHTWYEIRKEAIDNILDANVVTAALRERGCFTSQVGGLFAGTRTIRYGKKETQEIDKGSILTQGEDELETMARWDWKYFATHVQRNAIDDQKNNGKLAIKSLVATKLKAAKEALQEKLEDVMFGARSATAEDGDKSVQGLNELVPPFDNRAQTTFGYIKRENDWWQNKYKAATANPEVNLMGDMKNLFNNCTAHIESPNLIITGQEWFEIYEDFALEMSQLIVSNSGKLVDLGYRVLKFKGADMVWVPDAKIQISSANQMLMLNTNYIELVYDPQMWFSATDWKPIALQTERIMHILCACNLLGTQPRRHGRLYAT